MNKLHNKFIEETHQKYERAGLQSNFTRARSVTVGTCFNGIAEIILRAHDGSILWAPLEPVEVGELIHQLAGTIGCHVNIQPRKDFLSYRYPNFKFISDDSTTDKNVELTKEMDSENLKTSNKENRKTNE